MCHQCQNVSSCWPSPGPSWRSRHVARAGSWVFVHPLLPLLLLPPPTNLPSQLPLLPSLCLSPLPAPFPLPPPLWPAAHRPVERPSWPWLLQQLGGAQTDTEGSLLGIRSPSIDCISLPSPFFSCPSIPPFFLPHPILFVHGVEKDMTGESSTGSTKQRANPVHPMQVPPEITWLFGNKRRATCWPQKRVLGHELGWELLGKLWGRPHRPTLSSNLQIVSIDLNWYELTEIN